jgi:cation transport protein ChaC
MEFAEAAAVIDAARTHHAMRVMTDEERESSLEEILRGWDGETPLWVFAYGSLIWNPQFEFDAKRCVVVHGYHRSLCLWSKVWRGTPQQPGLVLALDRGGSCQGVAYRIPAQRVREELATLWKRELVTGAYSPRWLNVRGCGPCSAHGHELVTAIGFVIRREDPGYAGELDPAHLMEILRTARGVNGSSAEYLRSTVRGLVEHGIGDRHLTALVDRLEKIEAGCAG